MNVKIATAVCLAVTAGIVAVGCSTPPVGTPSQGASPSPATTPPTGSVTPPVTPVAEPVDIVSVLGPLQPINPGGPIVEMTLRNISNEPVVSLNAAVELGRIFVFTFDVGPDRLLWPGMQISSRQVVIGGGFGGDTTYPVTISGTLQSGATFNYVRQATIRSASEAFTDSLPLDARQTTVEKVSAVAGFHVPVPAFLPDGFRIQEIYMVNDTADMLISDGPVQKTVVTVNGSSGPFQRYEFSLPVEIGVRWRASPIPGGLKLPGPRPEIIPLQGTTAGSVLVDRETHYDLWWQWYPGKVGGPMYEIVISAGKQVSPDDLVRVAESMW